MVTESENIYEYEELLLGKRDRFEISLQAPLLRDRRIEAGNIWRYAVTHLLKWTPEQAAVYMTESLARMLYLDKTYEKTGFKKTIDGTPDFRVLLSYAFPKRIRIDEKAEAIEEYKHKAKLEKWGNECVPYEYPKGFFIGKEGIQRATWLLEYVINLYLRDNMTNKDLYAFFAPKKKAKKWLASKDLDYPLKIIYKNALDYYHYSLAFEYRDDFLYNFHRINEVYKEKVREIKKAAEKN